MDDRPLSIRVRTDRPKQLASLLIAGPAAVGVRAASDDALVVDTDDVGAFRQSIARAARTAGARNSGVAIASALRASSAWKPKIARPS